jgi:hypothetical protein
MYLVKRRTLAAELVSVAGAPEPSTAIRVLLEAFLDGIVVVGTWRAKTGKKNTLDVTLELFDASATQAEKLTEPS